MKTSFAGWLGKQARCYDPVLLICALLLSAISILTIFGAVDNFGRSKLVMQVAMTVVGTVAMLILAHLDYRFFVDRLFPILLIGSALLLIVTLIFGSSGENIKTANRSWLEIPGINIAIQPSEFVKVAFLCTFSKHLSAVRERINRPLVLLGVLAHAGVIVGLILASGDLGVALVYLGMIAIMLFCAGLSMWYFLAFAVILAAASPLIWKLLATYQKERILYGFRPALDPNGVGRQSLMSRDTIAGGGFFGVGLFSGGRYEALAASHTDFIFSTICEKFGLLGGGITVSLLVVMAVRLLRNAQRCGDWMGRLICTGIAALVIVQSLENLWMCLGLVPVVGITLPFLSCGGSSVLSMYLLMSLAHSVCNREKRFYFRRGSRTEP